MKSFRRFIATIAAGFLYASMALLLLGMTCRLSMGADWTAINTGLTDLDIRVLAIDPVNKGILYAGGTSGRFKTVDSGATWSMTGVALTGIPGLPTVPLTTSGIVVRLAIDSINPNTLYAVTLPYPTCGFHHRRVLKSSDGRVTWTPFNDGLQDLDIRTLALAFGEPNALYAGTPSGVFKIIDDLPVLSLEAPRLCVGASWTVTLSKAAVNRSATLWGIGNSQSWEVRDWHTTDAARHFVMSGTFAVGTEGRHILRIAVGGVLSNSISFVVSNCRTEETE